METHDHDHDTEGHSCHFHPPRPTTLPTKQEVEHKVQDLQRQKELALESAEEIDRESVGDWTEIYKKCAILEDMEEIGHLPEGPGLRDYPRRSEGAYDREPVCLFVQVRLS